MTGGAGFIGSHLVERLLERGHEVIVIDDFSTGSRGNLAAVASHPRLRVIEGRVSSCRELPALAARVGAIYHLAAVVGVERVMHSPVSALTMNFIETAAVLEAAVGAGTPVLLTSSSEVYARNSRVPLSEDDELVFGPPTVTRWGYGCSKLMDEFLALACARERGLPVVVARPFNTVGPRQTGRYGMVLPRFLASARAGEPLRVHGDGRQTRCFCAVADTVEALIRLQNTPAARGQVVNVGSDQEISIRALAERVVAATKSSSRLEFVPYAEAYGPGFEDLARRRPALDKLETLTGLRPGFDLESVVRAMLEADSPR